MNKIIVVGDSIIDKYIYGTITRNNPENVRGDVIEYDQEDLKLGGALSVASIISYFDQDVFLYCAVGNDYYDFVKLHLDFLGVNYFFEPTTYTTTKTRLVINDGLCKHRLDYDFFFDALNRYPYRSDGFKNIPIKDSDIIVIQDYGKGLCSQKLMDYLSNFNNKIIVDPYINDNWDKYPNPFLIKCNKNEAFKNIGYKTHLGLVTESLSNKYKCHFIITDGDNGMFLYDRDLQRLSHIPSVQTNVVDVCGAGDTVLATIATGISKSLTLEECCKLASITASEQITTIGINRIKNVFI